MFGQHAEFKKTTNLKNITGMEGKEAASRCKRKSMCGWPMVDAQICLTKPCHGPTSYDTLWL